MYKQHIILDLEMNPIPVNKSAGNRKLFQETIEIGAVKLDYNYKIIDRFNCFVKPELSSYIAPKIARLTGIRTKDICNAVCFGKALSMFSEWIGDTENNRIYSWSDSDIKQIVKECDYKNVYIPDNMKRWLDFQRVYPRIMKITKRRRQMALKEAAKYYGVEINEQRIHSALYDAEVTTELLIPILNGEYIKQINCLNRYKNDTKCFATTLGEKFGDVLYQFMNSTQPELVR